MVEGLQVDVPSDTLRKILEERLAYHKRREAVYLKKGAEIKKELEEEEEDMFVGKSSAGDNNEQKAKTHKEKANYYDFMIRYCIKDETYRLGQRDLQLLGIATGHMY